MPVATTKLTRKQLHEKVWTTPVTRIAIELGIPLARLVKLCDQHGIPRPPHGHWKRIELGLPTQDIELPEVSDPDLEEVLLFREQFEQRKKQKPAPLVLVVPDSLIAPHKLIVATLRHLKHAKAAENGKRYPDTSVCLDVFVTPAALDRTLRIYDTLIKHWESIGGSVQIGVETHTEKRITVFKLNKVSVPVSVIEVVHRKELPRKPDRYGYGYSRQEFTYHPTGKLQFQTNGPYGSVCADGRKQDLETNPLVIVNSIREVFEKIRVVELDRACSARQEAQLDRLHEEREERKKREESRREALLKDFGNWKKAGAIRQYLAALRTNVDAGLYTVKDEQDFEAWFDWAQWYADVCDPLVTAAEREEYVQRRSNRPVEALDLTHAVRHAVIQLGVKDCDELEAVTLPKYKLAHGRGANSGWREVGRILVIHGYDVSQREEVSYWS